MLVNKPQFNTQELRPGTPVKVTGREAINGSYAWAAIVVEAGPLEIEVVRVNKDRDDFTTGFGDVETVTIKVDSVANNYIKIEKLVPAKEGE